MSDDTETSGLKRPRVGCIVHYWPHKGERKGQPLPAIITHVWSRDTVNLHVFADDTFPECPARGCVTSCNRVVEGLSREGKWSWPSR